MLKRGVCWKHAGERHGEHGHLRLVCIVTDLIITKIITSVYMNESRQSRGKRVHSPHRQVPCICPHDPLQQPRLYRFLIVQWHVLSPGKVPSRPDTPGQNVFSVALRKAAPIQLIKVRLTGLGCA
jgi:hypothetical protein